MLKYFIGNRQGCFIRVIICFFQAEDAIRYLVRSRGLGDVYKRQPLGSIDGTPATAGVLAGAKTATTAFRSATKRLTGEEVFHDSIAVTRLTGKLDRDAAIELWSTDETIARICPGLLYPSEAADALPRVDLG